MISSVSLPFINSSLSLLVCMRRVSLESDIEETKLICAVNWIHHSSMVLSNQDTLQRLIFTSFASIFNIVIIITTLN